MFARNTKIFAGLTAGWQLVEVGGEARVFLQSGVVFDEGRSQGVLAARDPAVSPSQAPAGLGWRPPDSSLHPAMLGSGKHARLTVSTASAPRAASVVQHCNHIQVRKCGSQRWCHTTYFQAIWSPGQRQNTCTSPPVWCVQGLLTTRTWEWILSLGIWMDLHHLPFLGTLTKDTGQILIPTTND